MANGCTVLIFLTLVVCQQLVLVVSEVTFMVADCIEEYGNYSQNSLYQKNLNTLLTEISSQASVVRFGNHAVGEIPDTVYGFFQCREDLNMDVCSQCIQDARAQIVQKCDHRCYAIVWYDECVLRYNNFSFSETTVTEESSIGNVSNYNHFAPILASTLASLKQAMAQTSPRLRHFATREANLTLFAKLYSFAQCAPDLDPSDCYNCLSRAENALVDDNCKGRLWAMVYMLSCLLRYDTIAPFYDVITDQGQPSEPPVPPPIFIKSAKYLKPPAIVGITVGTSVGAILLLCVIWLYVHRKKSTSTDLSLQLRGPPNGRSTDEPDNLGDTEFERYDFATLSAATHNFSIRNKLGEGGFGAVYKGTLKNGQEIAIKRLSSASRQGAKEFMNETSLVAKLQHRNLVKLLGYCSEGEEKLLVYEFMPNTSLDRFFLDATKQASLEWDLRYKIILGIARGLQYLHEDSRLIIIHRDLKTSNILLDKEMNPKIADFGMARLFGGEQKLGNTSLIAGTYGYMAPEYLENGEYSNKSDVYSFGIVVLEIVSGQRNMISYQSLKREGLPHVAWRLWKEERSFELTDPIIQNNCQQTESDEMHSSCTTMCARKCRPQTHNGSSRAYAYWLHCHPIAI